MNGPKFGPEVSNNPYPIGVFPHVPNTSTHKGIIHGNRASDQPCRSWNRSGSIPDRPRHRSGICRSLGLNDLLAGLYPRVLDRNRWAAGLAVSHPVRDAGSESGSQLTPPLPFRLHVAPLGSSGRHRHCVGRWLGPVRRPPPEAERGQGASCLARSPVLLRLHNP